MLEEEYRRDWDALLYAQSQQMKAKSRTADGQCEVCGSFRIDGKPPTSHRTGCLRAGSSS